MTFSELDDEQQMAYTAACVELGLSFEETLDEENIEAWLVSAGADE